MKPRATEHVPASPTPGAPSPHGPLRSSCGPLRRTAVLVAALVLLPDGVEATGQDAPRHGDGLTTGSSPATAPWARQEAPIVGSWAGTIEIPQTGASLRIVFHVASSEEGGFSATMDSPDQGATGIPVSQVAIRGDSVRLEVTAVGGTYAGVKTGADEIEGVWRQQGLTVPLSLERGEETGEPRRPQEPEPPFPYRTEEVRFENPEGGFELAGTLTLPEGEGPFPGAVLVSGSGPQDRDGTVFGHRPFLVLADRLTRAGVAVLRADDRGVDASGGSLEGATTEDLGGDALSGARYLADHAAVDSLALGIVGHSEGALVAPMAADRSSLVSCLVLLAPPGLPGDRLLPLQARAIMEAGGASEEEVESTLENQGRIFQIVRSASGPDEVRRLVREHLERRLSGMTEEERARSGITNANRESWIRAQVEQVASPWFRYFLRHDPVGVLEGANVPVLALFGGLDLQVPPAENLPAVREALERSDSPEVTVLELDGLNHLLQPAATGTPAEYGRIETTMAPRALEEIRSWYVEHCGGPGGGS